MAEAGFLDQKKARPTSAALVVLLHGAGITALTLAGTEIVEHRPRPTTVETIHVVPPPPPEPTREPTKSQPDEQTHQSAVDRIRSPLPTPRSSEVSDDPVPPQPPTGRVSDQPTQPLPTLPPVREPVVPPPVEPVRLEAQMETRGSALQPPYPASEQRLQREGSVTIMVTIGTNGRVIAAERVSATSDAFYSATERHARARWRFRPATVDGRPVESSRRMTVQFRLDGD